MPQRDGQAPEDPAGLVAGLARAHITARCLHVIAEYGAADALGSNGSTPAELAKHLQSEMTKWGPVIADARIRIEN